MNMRSRIFSMKSYVFGFPINKHYHDNQSKNFEVNGEIISQSSMLINIGC